MNNLLDKYIEDNKDAINEIFTHCLLFGEAPYISIIEYNGTDIKIKVTPKFFITGDCCK